jgi:DNA-binding beta-propeller fold protein YncE
VVPASLESNQPEARNAKLTEQPKHPTHATHDRLYRMVVFVATSVVSTLLLGPGFIAPPSVQAAEVRPEPLISFPGAGTIGSAAGQLSNPRSLAASPVTGDIYVAEGEGQNLRISEFTAWGTFVRAFGWGVVDGATELQTCSTASGCRPGSSGAGPGQLARPAGSAVDSAGNLFVFDALNQRVTKYDSEGHFLLMFGGDVDKTTGSDICTAADLALGNECGIGVPGTTAGAFEGNGSGNYLAVGPEDTVYVGDKNRIQEFDSNGAFKKELVLPEPGGVQALAVDSGGDIYIALAQIFTAEKPAKPFVYKLSPTGTVLAKLTVGFGVALAVDSSDNLYVAIETRNPSKEEIMMFGPAGEQLLPTPAEQLAAKEEYEKSQEGEPFEVFERFGEPKTGGKLIGLTADAACAPAADDIYLAYTGGLAYVNAFGPPPQDALKCPSPPPAPPEIDAQFATTVGIDHAAVRAEINPRYALDADYYVQYGTGKCSEGQCETEQPLPPGAHLSGGLTNTARTSSDVFLSGLLPETTYHFRFVVQSGGGGPVRGVGGRVGQDGEESTFTTFPPPAMGKSDCPNQVYRTGSSALLPDCRAYELVSPPGRSPAGDIVSELNSLGRPAELNQSAVDGEKLAYSSEFAFGDSVSAPYTSEYIATRHAGVGWATHAISPPRGPDLINNTAGLLLDIEDKAFTADLCTSWLMHDFDPPLSANAVPGYPQIYRRSNCGTESYDSLTSTAPQGTPPKQYWPELQGFSTDGARAVFRANGKLTADAPLLNEPNSLGHRQLYESSGGLLHFLCVLPDGTPLAAPCSAGTANQAGGDGRTNAVDRAVSADGTRVYWTGAGVGPGPIYLRENSDQEQSAMVGGACTEEQKACTYQLTGEPAQFWAAAVNGSRAFYTVGQNLREFDADTRKSRPIAGAVVGVVGVSDDGLSVYFVSTNELGGHGVAGAPNLYLRIGNITRLVATLSTEDVGVGLASYPLAPGSLNPIGHGARISPDGTHLIFASTASLTNYDNTDALTGTPADEIYLYDGESEHVQCVSCNPTGARPSGRTFHELETRQVSSMIPTAENQLYAPNVLTPDGARVFFDSFEPLVPRDTNGKEDVYEWERAGDEEGCRLRGAELYVQSGGGCLSLISSGENPSDSQFIDASRDGRDVFLKTAASLVRDDPGLIDIYDARELGGLPARPGVQPGCEGEACQSPLSPPNDPAPSSSIFDGAGNVHQQLPRRSPHCRTGKRKVKGHCVHKGKHKHRKRSNQGRTSR